jgi:DNA-binding NarL/FixJ family response regulator
LLEPTRAARVVVADDDQLFASGLAAALESDERVEVIGIAANGEEAVQLACWQDPDIVLMDVEMPLLGGLEATELVRQSRPRVCVLIISGHEPDSLAADAERAGAAGFIHKQRIPDELVDRILELCPDEPRRPAA